MFPGILLSSLFSFCGSNFQSSAYVPPFPLRAPLDLCISGRWVGSLADVPFLFQGAQLTYPSSQPSVTTLPEIPQEAVAHADPDNQLTTEEKCDSDASDSRAFSTPLIQEKGCFGVTPEKKYYEFDDIFIKRSLAPSEYRLYYINKKPFPVIPRMCPERMKNEVAAIRYIQSNTNIPTPNIRCTFEDNGRFYIITDIVPGVTLADLPDDKKAGVIKEVEGYMAQMHAIKSKVMGGISGDNVLPYRCVKDFSPDECSKILDLKFRESDTAEFVLCHNDLSQHNIIVDEKTLEVKAILDWEYAGFYPAEFDGKFYLRPGASVALEGEDDDVPKLKELLDHWKA
ncbi:hypothetical protein GALMADRAFT_252940 [Galerina marginata CBS 339.88]|uniref:Aminoglycoside phosphotransferase domain-containing protein n=1 Tax=Galerina marginata (strain CBS 339.88) TaxID=685588 RepID=A0A067SYE6_GALM3|nr:hypothetical protein GALMADRAFT_252940 [Galerina marginata CBS 339.88]